MRARLKVYVKCRPFRIFLGGKDRVNLGMALAIALMSALSDNLAFFHDHGADQRIGVRFSAARAGKKKCPPHEEFVLGGHYFLVGFSVLAMWSKMPFTNLEESDSP